MRRGWVIAVGLLISSAAWGASTRNGMSTNGMSTNGMSTNGMSTNGMSTNGMSTNGMSTNGAHASGQVAFHASTAVHSRSVAARNGKLVQR